MTKNSGNFLRSVQGRWAFCLFLLLLLLAAMLGSLCCGVLNLPAGEVLSTLWNGNPEMEYRILFQIRLPRILLAALSGASLAVSGTILQGVMRNPLASPDIIGISSGGGFAGILVMLMFPAYTHLLLPAAFSGALATAFLVYLLSWKRGASPMRLILAGVAVSSMLGALSSALLLFHADKAGNILDFTLGSFSARSWEHLKACWIYMGTGFAGAALLGPALNILALGDESAAALGLKVERTRFFLLAISALLAASAVSVGGLLGFVGLVAPHVVRLIIGSDNRFLLPGSALFGALLLTACDTAGRILSPGGASELPAGMMMALLGPPFFLWLLRRNFHET